jgi:hypothetical protein
MGGTLIRRIAISPTTGGADCIDPKACTRISPAAGKGVRLVMHPAQLDPSHENVRVRREWDADIVSYSFFRISLEHRLPFVYGFSIDGQREWFRSSQPSVLPTFDRSRIVPPVRRAVKRSGTSVIEFNLFRPAGAAFAVVVGTDHPGPFIEHRLSALLGALQGVETRLDGYYLAVTDSRRSVVFAYSSTRGFGLTRLYVRPDLARCALLPEIGFPGELPDGTPPCPKS